MKELVEVIAKALVDNPDEVVVAEKGSGKNITVELHVAPADMGKVIGKQGRIAKAIRSVVKAASSKENIKVDVEIVQKLWGGLLELPILVVNNYKGTESYVRKCLLNTYCFSGTFLTNKVCAPPCTIFLLKLEVKWTNYYKLELSRKHMGFVVK